MHLLGVPANQDDAASSLRDLKVARIEVLTVIQRVVKLRDGHHSFVCCDNPSLKTTSLHVPKQHTVASSDHEAAAMEIDRDRILTSG